MSDRRFDVSGLQIMASVLAALSGAILASYLGVAGTIIGTAVMSVAATGGTAFYKHYLGRTAEHLKETAPVAAAHRAAEWMTAGTRTAAHSSASGRAAAAASGTGAGRDTEPDEGADAARDSAATGDTGTTRAAESGQDADTAQDTAAGQTRQGDAAAAARPGWLARFRATVRGWPRWLQVAAVSAVVFVGVIGVVTVIEVAAGKPLQTVVWNHKASGTTVGNLVGGQPAHTRPASRHPSPSSSAPSSSAPASTQTHSSSPSPSPTPTSPSPSPTTSTSSPPTSSTSPSPDPTGARTPTATAKASTG